MKFQVQQVTVLKHDDLPEICLNQNSLKTETQQAALGFPGFRFQKESYFLKFTPVLQTSKLIESIGSQVEETSS